MDRPNGERLNVNSVYEKASGLAEGSDPERAVATKLLLPKLDHDPHDAKALYTLAYVFMKSGNYGLAYQMNKRAVELAPHVHVIWHNLGKCAYECQKFDEAEQYWRHA